MLIALLLKTAENNNIENDEDDEDETRKALFSLL